MLCTPTQHFSGDKIENNEMGGACSANGGDKRPIREGADTSLARPTSQYRRTESIVSLERGVYTCAELQDFSCYRG